MLSALGEDVPLPTGLLINGIGHRWGKEFGAIKDAQSASFDQFLDKAQFKTFGAAVPSGWKQASSARSGSLTTLLLTHTDGHRVVFVSDLSGDALKAYLTSGVVQSAGFTYDKDTFNGFEALVDIAIGNWTGTVLVGSASIDGVEYQDLVWALHR